MKEVKLVKIEYSHANAIRSSEYELTKLVNEGWEIVVGGGGDAWQNGFVVLVRETG